MNKSILVLAKNWEYIKLGDIVQKISNGITKRQLKSGSGISVTRIETISNGIVDLNKVGYLKDLTRESIEKYKLMKDDILFSHINSDYHLGKTAIFNLENIVLLHGMNLLLIRVNPRIIRAHFLNYLFKYYRFTGYFISIAQHAVNQSSINQKKIKNILIPLPPLNEQNRIVEKIEELFSGLDKATEELEKVRGQLKVYRQSVLKAAFEGKLTEHEKIIPKYISNFGKSIEIVSGQTPKGINNVCNIGKIPFYKISDMNTNGNEVYVKESKIKLTMEDIKKYKIKVHPKGTVIFPKRGGAILTNKKRILFQDATFDLNTMGVIPNKKIISKYLYYWFLKIDLGTIYDGSSVPQINRKDIVNIKISTPDISIQNQIVQEIESRLSVCDKIEESVESGLKKIEHLRQSILKKAFEGKLVPQNPKDPSVEELLEQIKIEKEKTKNNSKKKVKA